MYKGKGKTLKAKETLQSRGNEANGRQARGTEIQRLLARDARELGNQGPSPYAKTSAPGAKTPTTASKDKIAPRWV